RKRKRVRKGVKRDYTYDLYVGEDTDPKYLDVLNALCQYRLLSTKDAETLLSVGKSTAYRIMANLHHNKLVNYEYMDATNRRKGGQRTSVYFLTRGGFQFLLRERQKLGLKTPYFAPISSDMSQEFMRHTIGITQAMIRFYLATKLQGWSVHQYTNEWFFK